MVNNSILVPCVVFGAIATCMFIFICWWFPRAWAKGQTADLIEFSKMTAARRQRERELELASGDVTETEGGQGDGGTGTEPGGQQQTRAPQPPRSVYLPPVAGY